MDDVELAIAAVNEAATIVRDRLGSALGRIDKGDGDFATNIDIEAERAIWAVLRRERPGDRIHGEELGASAAGDPARTWLIDPLCGTLNYAAGMRVVAVNVALRTAAGVAAAAVSDPFAKEVFWTDAEAAYRRVDERDEPLMPSGQSHLVDLNFDPPFPSAPSFRTVALAADSEFVATFKPRVVSSSLAMTWVATGQRAAYITDGVVGDSVHFAPGLAICAAAGCHMSDLRGHPWSSTACGLVVAADEHTHAQILRLIAQAGP